MKRLLTIIFLLLALTVSAQRVIENPVIGVRGMGACTGFFIDKIVLNKDVTKFYMTNYHGYAEGKFLIVSGTRIVADGKPLKVISAEGITLDEWTLPKDNVEFVTHFVLNFPAIDKSVETIDFIEGDNPNGFHLYDIALTDQAAERIKQRITMPDAIRNYAANIQDNGESLEREEFTMQPATVKGKIYGYDKRFFAGAANVKFEVEVNIENPFLRRETVATEIKPDGTYELQVPMTVKHQAVWLIVNPIYSNKVVLAAGKTVEVDFDFTQIYRPWELPDNELTPYFAGENVDLNYAINLPFLRNFMTELVYNDESRKKVANFTMPQFKEYILDGYNDYVKRIDTMHVTKRAKEFLKLSLKFEAAYSLARAYLDLPMMNARVNSTANEIVPMRPDKDYLYFPKNLDIDNIMMFYTYDMAEILYGWRTNYELYVMPQMSAILVSRIWDSFMTKEKLSKKEKAISVAIVKKIKERDTTRTDAEFAFQEKYSDKLQKYANEEYRKFMDGTKADYDDFFQGGEGLFWDFNQLRNVCFDMQSGVLVPDSVISEIEKLPRPFYAQYIKAKNSEVLAKIEAEKARGGYYAHQPGESVADSLLVELLKDCHGKVVLIDFWNTWCGPCRGAMKEMEPMKAEFEGKDVAFVYVADTSSPVEEYNTVIPTVKGQHHRLPESDVDALKRKWNFSGIPAYVLIGKDGMVKDCAGHGTEYFRMKINEELRK
ncbi:MAG: TlpA family protein disulfide reductase [Bacteroidales bacterium]|nr:TlpA family protein disulfide reductase [Bacteroidales bacterium]